MRRIDYMDEKLMVKYIVEKIRSLCIQNSVNLEDVVRAANVNKASLYKVMNQEFDGDSNPAGLSILTIEKICFVFGISVSSFFSGFSSAAFGMPYDRYEVSDINKEIGKGKKRTKKNKSLENILDNEINICEVKR